MDIRMPSTSGMELYNNIIAKHPEFVGKFIFVIGDTSDQNTRAFLEQNNLSYIAKPFDRETLTKKVNDIL
jgi:DNA-binding NarL/FixJ family response regulator